MDDQPAQEWAAEHSVGLAQATELVAGQFPQLRGASVDPLGTGWDNTVYLVDRRWAFRFPRRSVALPGVRREIDVLPRVAQRLPLATPLPQFVGTPSEAFPWPFWGARLIPGRELAEARLPEDDRGDAAVAVGEFLRTLHDPDLVTEEGLLDLPVDPWRRGDPSVRTAKSRERLARLAQRGIWEPDPSVERLLDEAERLGAPDSAPVLVHGDLHIRHLLVDGDGQAAGVIDWGDLCLADPALDLSLAYSGFSGAARAALLAAYGPVDTEREIRARALAIFICAILVDYAAVETLPHLLGEALAGLRRAGLKD